VTGANEFGERSLPVADAMEPKHPAFGRLVAEDFSTPSVMGSVMQGLPAAR